MRILFFNSIRENIFGGMEEWIRLVGSGLVDRGHFVAVAGRTNSDFLRRLGISENKIEQLALDISGDFNPFTIRRVALFLKDNGVQLIIVNFNKDLRIGGIAARWCGNVKVIWSIGIKITRDNWIHRKLTPRLFDGIIVPSESLKSQIISDGYIPAERVTVIPVGIDEPKRAIDRIMAQVELRRKYSLPDEAMIAVTSGRFVEQKGHQYLVEAAPAILNSNPNSYFLWLGSGPLETKLRSRINALSLERHFVFAGMLEDIDLELNGADLLIHPSVEEPFGVAVLEGMRAGLPIVASRVGGIPEVVKEGTNAALFEPESAQALVSAVIAVMQSAERMREMAAASTERWREHFGYDRMINRVENYFQEILHDGRN